MNFHPKPHKPQRRSPSKKQTPSKPTSQETFGPSKNRSHPKRDSKPFEAKTQKKTATPSSKWKPAETNKSINPVFASTDWKQVEENQRRKPTNPSTDWNRVSEWYDHLVGEKGTDYQREIIFPGALKLMKLTPKSVVLDLACGQGVFCRELFQKKEYQIIGVDASKEMIEIAKNRSSEEISFFIQNATKLSSLSLPPVDVIVCLLAIQNMDAIGEIFKECAKVLKPEGRLVLMMSHPCFRIPRQSHWGYEKAVQFRRIDRYMSEMKVPIITHPGKDPDLYTWTFHRPMYRYLQALFQNGFMIDGFEEFISHRFTDSGPRAPAENLARTEIPLFLGLSAKKVGQLK